MTLDNHSGLPEAYDALLVVSFGGPEGMDEVMPFLENVLRGRNVPHERMVEVSHHYELFGGVSPINAQNRALIAALQQELEIKGPNLPIYWGNRNWHPMLTDTVRQMASDGVKNALAFVTSAYSSYSGCRQYREDIQRAQAEVGPDAPQISVLRKFYNHPGFIQPNVENVGTALQQIPQKRRAAAEIAFTAHSIPKGMAQNSNYEAQLKDTCQLIADELEHPKWQLVYQSRSGGPGQPWLEPDINDHLKSLKANGVTDVVVAPIGFISDHMEVLFDLDTEVSQLAEEIDLNVVRAATAGVNPAFISMIRELVVERIRDSSEKRFLGTRGPSHDVCPVNCCLPTLGRPVAAKVSA
ncbi:MAG: ferrochelatase [Anaerolineae bacterium]|nr:ferrochelatase [Anaerolineae bacterium]